MKTTNRIAPAYNCNVCVSYRYRKLGPFTAELYAYRDWNWRKQRLVGITNYYAKFAFKYTDFLSFIPGRYFKFEVSSFGPNRIRHHWNCSFDYGAYIQKSKRVWFRNPWR